MNAGDCYILVTPDKITTWVGEFSNVIEKAKVNAVHKLLIVFDMLWKILTYVKVIKGLTGMCNMHHYVQNIEQNHLVGAGSSDILKTNHFMRAGSSDILKTNHLMGAGSSDILKTNHLMGAGNSDILKTNCLMANCLMEVVTGMK